MTDVDARLAELESRRIVPGLSVAEQNELRDCEITLGMAAAPPRARAEAARRVERFAAERAAKKTKRQIAREVDEILAKPLPRHERWRRVDIDHSDIPRNDLRIAKVNAARDPDGQVFPWRPMYPLIGATVYYDGRLWTVAWKERGPSSEQPTSEVKLVGQGHDDTALATRGELRPITWTQRDEDLLGRD
jgi:hypothetical protein